MPEELQPEQGKRGKDPEIPVAGGKMRDGAGLEGCCCLSCKEEFVQGQLLGLEELLLLLG